MHEDEITRDALRSHTASNTNNKHIQIQAHIAMQTYELLIYGQYDTHRSIIHCSIIHLANEDQRIAAIAIGQQNSA